MGIRWMHGWMGAVHVAYMISSKLVLSRYVSEALFKNAGKILKMCFNKKRRNKMQMPDVVVPMQCVVMH